MLYKLVKCIDLVLLSLSQPLFPGCVTLGWKVEDGHLIVPVAESSGIAELVWVGLARVMDSLLPCWLQHPRRSQTARPHRSLTPSEKSSQSPLGKKSPPSLSQPLSLHLAYA